MSRKVRNIVVQILAARQLVQNRVNVIIPRVKYESEFDVDISFNRLSPPFTIIDTCLEDLYL